MVNIRNIIKIYKYSKYNKSRYNKGKTRHYGTVIKPEVFCTSECLILNSKKANRRSR